MTLANADIIAAFIRRHGIRKAESRAASIRLTGDILAEFYERNREAIESGKVAA
jgi:hypothetical protein